MPFRGSTPARHRGSAGSSPYRGFKQSGDANVQREKNAPGLVVSRKGNTPTNVPDRVGNLWLTYDFNPAWQGDVDARYVASVYADNANTQTVLSYTLYGSFLTFKVDEHTSITGRVRNLTDQVYARFAHVSSAYYLGEPRTFELAVQTRF